MEDLMATTESVQPRQEDGMSNRAFSHDKRWWILAVLGVSQLMVTLDNTIVNIALPTAQHALHFSNADRQWIVTAYSLAFGSLLLLGGRIGDIIGRKRALVIGLIGFAVASAIGGASTDFIMLVGARTVQGAFGALLAPSVLALLTTTFSDPGERGKAFGINGAIAGAGGAIGLLLGGILTSYASWRFTLFVNLIFAAVATVGALLWLKNDRATDHDPVDFPGLFMVSVGLFSVVFGFSHAETTAWSNPYTIGFLILGVVLLGSFAWFETRAKFPLLPMRIVLNRTRGGSMLAMLFASIGVFGVFLFLTYYLQGTLGWSPVKTGLGFLPMVGPWPHGPGVQPRHPAQVRAEADRPRRLLLVRRWPVRAARRGTPHRLRQPRAAVHILIGVGFGLSLAPSFSTGTLGLAPQDAGVGSATVNTSQQVGGSIGTALLNTLAASAASAYLVGRALTPATQKRRAAQLHDGLPVGLAHLRDRCGGVRAGPEEGQSGHTGRWRDNFLKGAADDVVVIDTGNYSKERDGRIEEIEAGMTDSRWVEEQIGVSVVKAFNTIRAEHLLEFGKTQGTTGRIALPVAADDAEAKLVVMDLVDALGFDPVDGGGLDDSWRQQQGNSAYGADFDADDLRKALAGASGYLGIDRKPLDSEVGLFDCGPRLFQPSDCHGFEVGS
jgi:MFS family permease